MAFTIKLAQYTDMAECVRVEHESMPNYPGYLYDAWHYFQNQKGACVCVLDDDKMIGIGRFTVLPDGTGWLETLRVSIPHQGKGAGKAIYEKYHELAREYGCPSMAMFTGVKNLVSAGLAEKNGLRTSATHRGYSLTDLTGGNPHGFRPVNPQRASELALPLKAEYHDYMVFNRTFFHINDANIRCFATEGKVFEDPSDGSFIVCGARFQHNVALHIALMGGDYDRCIDFAVNHARAMGVPKVYCTFTLDNPKLEAALKARGFAPDPSDIITKEIVF
ncbi:MAG: GNAT family N-acetyltransferase [Clostridia bacterium]|nr:GNAT family N-acetyltransferase [Clostridia bacterium]